ncbi:FadR/GntR family transcriptional regulator [Limosilactobacillus sp.]|uniref:FadR/GntR family transcriptional regulator n=1 Tax=Limosilactobacillus sp. TaxID=2773925 RepID=UPI003F0AEB0B
MEFHKINAPSSTDLFVKQLEEAILSGQLHPGEQLPSERELQAQLGVSRNVVNTALRRLASQNLILMKPRQGNYVADFRKNGNLDTLDIILNFNRGHYNRHLLQSIIDMRWQVEPIIVFLAAQRSTDVQYKRIKHLLIAFDSSKDPREEGEIIANFFHELAIASDNDIYPLLVKSFSAVYRELTTGLCQAGKKAQISQLNWQLFSAIIHQDGDTAQERDRQLINWTKQVLIEGKW